MFRFLRNAKVLAWIIVTKPPLRPKPRWKWGKKTRKRRKRLPKCFATEKVSHKNRAEANKVAEKRKHKSTTGKLRAYKCEYCPYWHLTSKKQKKY